MHKFNLDAQAARIKLDLLKIGLLSRADSETKEYEADWLKPGQKVVRQGGKFAKKGGGSEALESAPIDVEILNSLGVSGTQVKVVREILSPDEQKRLDQAISTLQSGGVGEILNLGKKIDAIKEVQDVLKFYQPVADPKTFEAVQQSGVDTEALKVALGRLRVNKTQDKSTNHPLQQRVAELAKLKGSKDQQGAAWRKGLIATEIKYGETLDGIVSLPSPPMGAFGFPGLFGQASKLDAGREQLLQQIKVGKKNASKAVDGGGSALPPVYDPALGFIIPPDSDLRVKPLDQAFKAFADFKSLTNTPVNVVLDVTHQRGFQTKVLGGSLFNFFGKKEDKKPDSFINVGLVGEPKETTFHEMGHLLESQLNWSNSIAISYLDDRSKGDKTPHDLGGAMAGETARATDFLQPYTGKEYPGGTTEILAMGLAPLANSSELHNLATKDRDHLLFSLSALDAAPQKS